MSTRERPIDRADRLSRQDRHRIGTEIRTARQISGRSLEQVAATAGMSSSHASRIERAEAVHVPIERIVRLGAAVGLDVRIRADPGPDPVVDAAQLALLDRLRARVPSTIRLRTEVPLPIPGDQRAWDGLLVGLVDGTDLPIDADTRLVDVQAQTRRITLKRRDSGVEHVVWLLADTARNREAARSAGASLTDEFPVSPRAALQALGAGRHPGGSAVILL